MLINAIRAENLKSRHSNMWVAVLILPLLTAAIGAIIYGMRHKIHLPHSRRLHNSYCP